jgi:hypothetical protein
LIAHAPTGPSELLVKKAHLARKAMIDARRYAPCLVDSMRSHEVSCGESTVKDHGGHGYTMCKQEFDNLSDLRFVEPVSLDLNV